jgi:hypothetical protein
MVAVRLELRQRQKRSTRAAFIRSSKHTHPGGFLVGQRGVTFRARRGELIFCGGRGRCESAPCGSKQNCVERATSCAITYQQNLSPSSAYFACIGGSVRCTSSLLRLLARPGASGTTEMTAATTRAKGPLKKKSPSVALGSCLRDPIGRACASQ